MNIPRAVCVRSLVPKQKNWPTSAIWSLVRAPRGKRLAIALLLAGSVAWSQPRRKVIINEDCSGPGGSNVQTLALLIQSPQVEVLGITVVSGDQWRDEEVAHTLRLLEILGRTDIPVMKGAAFPLVHSRDEALHWQDRYGRLAYMGAWDERWWHEPFVVPALPEGQPSIKASEEDGVHFLLRMVRKYPREVTIYEGGPMTNLALAISLDPEFPALAQELVFMGGSLNPQTNDPEFANNPRHEFNFWFDPEAAYVVLRAPWRKITCTPTDISIKARLTPEMVKRIDASGTPLAHYIARFYQPGQGNDYMWDELAAAAWVDPAVITKQESRYISVDIDHGAGYGNTLTWTENDKPKSAGQPATIQVDLDKEKFYEMFVHLMSASTASRVH
jgi:purine nucleosidase